MKEVGIREFRDHASKYFSGGEPLAVKRHGEVVGVYLPVRRKSGGEELRAALGGLSESLEELRRDTGMSEEELVEALAPKSGRSES